MVGCLVGWLVGWMVLVGWLVSQCVVWVGSVDRVFSFFKYCHQAFGSWSRPHGEKKPWPGTVLSVTKTKGNIWPSEGVCGVVKSHKIAWSPPPPWSGGRRLKIQKKTPSKTKEKSLRVVSILYGGKIVCSCLLQ